MGLLDSLKYFCLKCLHWFVRLLRASHYYEYSRMTFMDKLLYLIVHLVDRYYAWYKLPVFLGLAYLEIRRTLHQRFNLITVGTKPTGVRYIPIDYPYRTADGSYNDPFNPKAGSKDTFFGRNMMPSPQKEKLLRPDPMVVATKLLARRKMIDTGKQFNMLAAAWIQFMIHDWIDHVEDNEMVEFTAPLDVAPQCPLKAFRFFKSKEVSTGFYDLKNGFLNRRTSWWDGSAIYGNDVDRLKKVRTFADGKLKLDEDDLLPQSDGIPVSGDIRNSWSGISVLQVLFIKEHNLVCDLLKDYYCDLDDEDLYRRARLVTSAVIAKIHTIDWTIELLKMDTLHAGMRANWYGLLGKKFKDSFGHTGSSLLSGFIGMPSPRNHGVPYSLTEEFVSVYRMHSLMPDSILFRDIDGTPTDHKIPPVVEEVGMRELIGISGQKVLSKKFGNKAHIVSMGHQACGAVELWNYPMWMRDLIAQDPSGQDRPNNVDLPALEIYRDRERSVPRYNQFRRNMLMIPISKWEDLTDDKEAIKSLQEVYGNDVENLDLLVGMMAEDKIKGFAISETAFFIFLLMATRRLEADRFFTSDFNEKVYTEKGLQWVNNTESLKDVLNRHYPELVEKWMNSSSAFSVWCADPEAEKYTPLYFRIPI